MTEDMTVMAIKYRAYARPFGYTFFKDTGNHIVSIYKDGCKIDESEHSKIIFDTLIERQRLRREEFKENKNEKSS